MDIGRDDRFRLLYAATFDSLLAYALRRSDSTEDAADVVSETFLVAWRRLADVPDGHEGRLWLFGVARRTLANQRRGDDRRDRLGQRLRQDLAAAVPDHADELAARVDLGEALSRLGVIDREVLELSTWEGLEPREIAVVLGVPARTVRTRLSRARARLRDVLGDVPGPDGHVPSESTTAAMQDRRSPR